MSDTPSSPASVADAKSTSKKQKDTQQQQQQQQQQRQQPPQNASGANVAAVPPHKVGRNVMYDQFVGGYDAIMQRHDCSAIQAAFAEKLQPLVLQKVSDSAKKNDSSPFLFRIADLGCGTGRASKLLLDAVLSCLIASDASASFLSHTAAACSASSSSSSSSPRFQICGVDKSAAMVQRFVSAICETLRDRGIGGRNSAESPLLIALPIRSVALEATRAATSAAAAAAASDVNGVPSSTAFSVVWGAVASLEEFCVDEINDVDENGSEHAASGDTDTKTMPAKKKKIEPTTAISFEPSPCLDVAVCAWALSHVASAQWGGDRWHAAVRRCVSAMENSIDKTTGGVIFIIETLGTDTETPTRHSSLHDFLVAPAEKAGGGGGCGFEPPIAVRTDYVFSSQEEGEKCVRFFFGDEMRQKFAKRVELSTMQRDSTTNDHDDDDDDNGDKKKTPTNHFRLPECTGIWMKRIAPTAATGDASSSSSSSSAAASSPQRRDRKQDE